MQGAAADLHVAVTHRAQTERVILFRVFFVADADQCGFEQPYHGRKNLPAIQATTRQIPCHVAANPRQCFSKRNRSLEFGAIARRRPIRVITVLLAPTHVPARRLDVSVRHRADPDIGPRGRNCETPDPGKGVPVPQYAPIGIAILDILSFLFARQAGFAVAHITQSSHSRHDGRFRNCLQGRAGAPAGGMG